mmetsp:Transcript_100540/g.138637  ORF Transcript_100540/g.138637 Transcript_100540/m.138637 type:complete len:288 (-) Transcript_100540:107-970(-)
MKFATTALIATAVATNMGAITVKEEGQDVTRYIIGANGYGISVNNNSVTLNHGARAYLGKDGRDLGPDNFQSYSLMNKTIKYDVNLGSVGCSCNAAFYLVTMPGYNSSWQPDPSQGGDYYCDANQVGGVWCWEMDVMEANKYVSQTTPHNCNSSEGGYINSCDRGGCQTNTWDWWTDGYGPGKCIDTNQTFTQWTTFKEGSIHVKLGQGDCYYDYDVCNYNQGYINSMEETFRTGMTFVFSHWGDSWNTMSWLDQKTGCWGDCDTSGHATWSNIEVYTESSLEAITE